MSANAGSEVYNLSNDHKPAEENETKRITVNGGRIYQNQNVVPNPAFPGGQ